MSALEQFELCQDRWKNFNHIHLDHYQFGPFVGRLAFANETLIPMMSKAFAHLKLAAYSNSPHLEIFLWDTASTGTQLPRFNWDLFNKRGYHGYQEDGIYLHYFDAINVVSIFNAKLNQGYFIAEDVKRLPWWVSGSPLQVLLHWWLREQGLQLTHSGAVGNNTSAILLTGKGGSGKSTTVLSCMHEGLFFLGEDYCILQSQPIPVVYSIYQSAKLSANTCAMFPACESKMAHRAPSENEKSLLFYDNLFKYQIKRALPLKALVSLRLHEQLHPRLQFCNTETILKDLLLSTVMQLPIYHSKTFHILHTLTKQLPAYQLFLGRDHKKNVEIIHSILCEK